MLRTIMLALGLIIATLSLPNAYAVEERMPIDVQLVSGKTFKVNAYDYINSRGQREMRFETKNMAGVVLGYGRDLDGDTKIDTFFIFGDNGMSRYERKIYRESSWTRARHVLAEHAKYSGKDYFAGIRDNVLSFLFFGANHLLEAQKTFYLDWMDLEELYMTLEANKGFMSREEYRYGLQLMIDGHQMAYDRLMTALGGEQAAMWGVDAALWLSGTVLLKWAGKAIKAISKKLTPQVERLGIGAGVVATRLSIKSYQATIHSTIKSVGMKSMLQKSKSVVLKGLKNIRAEWKYLAFSSSIQIGVETFVSFDEVVDEDPRQMASNLLGHPAVQENIAVSLTASTLMAASNGSIQGKFARFAVLGMVGAGSSYAVGTALSGHQSNERLAMDTAWSVGIDSAQFMLDLHVLHKFTQLAVKHRNRKLKLIGYAVVFVSQVTNFYAYSEATRWLDPQTDTKDGELKLVPITVATN